MTDEIPTPKGHEHAPLPPAEDVLNLLTGTELFMHLAEQTMGQLQPEMVGCPVCMSDLRKLRTMRVTILHEEHREYLGAENAALDTEGNVVALGEPDWVGIADGLLDQVVVSWGTLIAYYGQDLAYELAKEVIRSNLSKVDGTLGPKKLRDDGKVLKPEGWTPPDIKGVLQRAGYAV